MVRFDPRDGYIGIHGDLAEFVATLRNMPASGTSKQQNGFYGREHAAACDYIMQGASEAEQAEALALLAKIDAGTHGRMKHDHVPSVAGERVNVGAYLRGEPLNMKRRVRVEHDRAPIRVVVEIGVSGMVTTKQMARRGAACAALAMKLAEIRPTELWVMSGDQVGRDHSATWMVKIPNQPLSMATCVAVISSPEFTRRLAFAERHRVNGTVYNDGGNWGWGQSPLVAERNERVRRVLGLEPQDIFLPGGYITEADLFMRDPVAWVNSYLDAQRDVE